MAIIQISRIQVRRGRKDQGTGLPQLASGEIGWAIDAQELYIGNGSTQEGAPEVGNTRILTANDNVLELAGQYFYKENSSLPGRSIQARLDDFVSASSFGIVGNGAADDTVALQNAIDTVFGIGSSNITRSILYIPAGQYLISEPLRIPSYAQIAGAGIENTVIISNTSTVLETVPDELNPDQSLQARYINITNLSVVCETNSSAISLNSCRDSEFKNIKLTGSWEIASENNMNYGVKFNVISNLITCKNNIFENITIEKFARGIDAAGKIFNNTFSNINFYDLDKGIVFGDDPFVDAGPELNIIENCEFSLITNQAIEVIRGEHNSSRNNRFINVGNDGGNGTVSSVIEFATDTNTSIGDYFDRSALLAPALIDNNPSQINNLKYLPEIQGSVAYENLYGLEATIGDTLGEFDPAFRLPAIDSGVIFVNYTFVNSAVPANIREGTLKILVKDSVADIEDQFSTFGDTEPNSVSSMNFLEFSVSKQLDYIMIFAKNNLTNSRLYYTIKTKT